MKLVCIAPMSLFEFITLVIMFIGLVIALWQLLWSMPPRRHIDIILNFNRTWQSEAFTEAKVIANQNAGNLKEMIERYDTENRKEYWLLVGIANFFEDLGTLVKKKQLNFEEVEDHFGPQIYHYYQLFKPWIEARRLERSDLYDYFKSLAEKIEQLYTKRQYKVI